MASEPVDELVKRLREAATAASTVPVFRLEDGRDDLTRAADIIEAAAEYARAWRAWESRTPSPRLRCAHSRLVALIEGP